MKRRDISFRKRNLNPSEQEIVRGFGPLKRFHTYSSDDEEAMRIRSRLKQRPRMEYRIRKKRKRKRRRVILPSMNFSDDSDSDPEGLDSFFGREGIKPRTSSRAGPSTNNYRDYEDVDEDTDPSEMRRQYIVLDDSDEDTDDSSEMRIAGSHVEIEISEDEGEMNKAAEEKEVTELSRNEEPNETERQIVSSSNVNEDETEKAPEETNENEPPGESDNDDIIPCPSDESTCIASRTRAETMSTNKAAEIGTDDSEVRVAEPHVVTEMLSVDENETEMQKAISSNENEGEMNKAPEGNDENSTNLADNEPSGEDTNLERDEGLLNNVPTEEEMDVAAFLKVLLEKKKNGEKSRKRNKLSEENEVSANDAPKRRSIRKKQPPYKLRSDLWIHETASSRSPALAIEPVATEDMDCDNAVGLGKEVVLANGEMPGAGEIIKKRETKKLSSVKLDKIFDVLGDSMSGQGPLVESESEDESRIPRYFKFEDETPVEEVEKTESEVEKENLFAEMNEAFAMVPSTLPEVNPEREFSPADDSLEARIARCSHETREDEQIGSICIHCGLVVVEAKDKLPNFARRRRYRPAKKRSAYTKELSEYVFKSRAEPSCRGESSVRKTAAFDSPNDGTVWDIIPCVREMYKHQQEGYEFLWKNMAGSTDIAEMKSMATPDEVGGCMISHAPGTGKTRLTIVFLETYLRVFPDSRPVIIAPASLLLTWEQELSKWDFPFPVHNINDPEFTGNESRSALERVRGTKSGNSKHVVRMIKLYSWYKRSSVLLISYSLFETLITGTKKVKRGKNKISNMEKQVAGSKNTEPNAEKQVVGSKNTELINAEKQVAGSKNTEPNAEKQVAGRKKIKSKEAEKLREILLQKPGIVILDEGHIARNVSSNLLTALLQLKTEKRVILSGTPFQNNFEELFNSLCLVRPAMVKDKKLFKIDPSKERKQDQSGPISETVGDDEIEKLKSVMLPYVNIHKGSILLDKLPGLGESVIVLKPPTRQRDLIKSLERESKFVLENKLSLISVHPNLLLHCKETEGRTLDMDKTKVLEDTRLNPNEGAKMIFIIELLRLCTAANEKVVIFSQFIPPLELIKDQLKEVFKWVVGKQILHIRGKQTPENRQKSIHIFNNPSSEARVVLASIKCCSEGISLVGASRVVLLDVVWNPSVERQAICRAYRIGQKKYVHTYRLMTAGTTEGQKYRRQAEKERMSELVFCSPNEESDKGKKQVAGRIEKDMILDQIVRSELKHIFDKVILEPKYTDIFENFGLIENSSEA